MSFSRAFLNMLERFTSREAGHAEASWVGGIVRLEIALARPDPGHDGASFSVSRQRNGWGLRRGIAAIARTGRL